MDDFVLAAASHHDHVKPASPGQPASATRNRKGLRVAELIERQKHAASALPGSLEDVKRDRPGTSRTQVQVIQEPSVEMRAPTSHQRIANASSASFEDPSLILPPYAAIDDSTEFRQVREPELVSIEDGGQDVVIEEVEQDQEMNGLDDARRGGLRRSMTPGPHTPRDESDIYSRIHKGDKTQSFLDRSHGEFTLTDRRDEDALYQGWDHTVDTRWKRDAPPLGPGAMASRLVKQEIHPHRGAFRVQLRRSERRPEMESSSPPPTDELSAFSESLFADMDDWYYCTDCCAWGRAAPQYPYEDTECVYYKIAGGLPYARDAESADQGHSDALAPGQIDQIRSTWNRDPPPNLRSAYAVEPRKWDAILTSINNDERDHFRSHHFHVLEDFVPSNTERYVIEPPGSLQHTGPLQISVAPVDPVAPMNLWTCCQCPLMVLNDDGPSIPGALTPELLRKLSSRDPGLRSSGSPSERMRDSLAQMAK
jgi:hypothetical protein